MRDKLFSSGYRVSVNLAPLFLLFLLVFPLHTYAKIVFASKQAGDTAYHIYAMEDNGSNLRRITSPLHYDHHPSWFPDGQWIVFERDLSRGNGVVQNAEFYIIDAIGMNEHRFMDNHPTDTMPRVSPNGKHIAFNSDRSGQSDIYTLHLESGRLRQVTDNFKHKGWALKMAWSPDSKQLAYENEGPKGENIWIVNADGRGDRKRLSPAHPGGTILWRNGARWSPSGKYIMYRELEGTLDWKKFAERLIVQNVLTGKREIHNFPVDSVVGIGCWMGNDSTVLLDIEFDVHAPDANYDIYRYDLGSRQLTNLTNLPKGNALYPHWVAGSLAVSPLEKLTVRWGHLKRTD